MALNNFESSVCDLLLFTVLARTVLIWFLDFGKTRGLLNYSLAIYHSVLYRLTFVVESLVR